MALNSKYKPTNNGTLLVNARNSYLYDKEELQKTISTIHGLIHRPKGNPYQQLMTWRKMGDRMLKMLCMENEAFMAAVEMNERYSASSTAKNYQRWTPEEDELLIDFVCREQTPTMVEVATTFGRSPAAIAQRVTKLVGKKRIEQSVAGRFIGTFNGVSVDGMVDGVIRKE